MRGAVKLALLLLAASVLAWLVFSWFEAGAEIEVLCSGFEPGDDRARVLETLSTGEYLRYRVNGTPLRETIQIDSPYDLMTTRCVVELEDGLVRAADVAAPTDDDTPAR